jgi:tetratricopeptide (TPR) repeat protein
MKTRLSFFIAALGISCITSSSTAHAQQVKADTGAVAIGRDLINSTVNIGIPTEQLALLVRQANDLSEAQKKLIAKLEGELDLNQHQIQAALDILGEANIPPERLGGKLVEVAEHLKVLQATTSTQPGVQKAIEAGELAKADAMLADVETEQRRALDRLAVNAAETSARRGEIALARLRYTEAAMHFANAAAALPQGGANEDKRIGYLRRETQALYRQGADFGDQSALLLAIERIKRLLTMTPRERVPLDWAKAQGELGDGLAFLGVRAGSTAALEEAVVAFHEALKERTRERVPLDWAATQNDLGFALEMLGQQQSDTAKLEEAVAAFREALKEDIRERAPLTWAMTQNNLGSTLLLLGQLQSDTAKLEEAIAVLREAIQLKGSTDERTQLDWALQSNLGTALVNLGGRKDDTAKLEEAVAAYREALKETIRERHPLNWATTQSLLGAALQILGERKDDTAKLEEAVVAYREALKENTRERAPVAWAMTQNNLGSTLLLLGQLQSDTAKLEEAVAAFREALKENTRERSPVVWAQTQRQLGYIHFDMGDFVAAGHDLEKAVDGTNAYPILWLHLARARADESDAKRNLGQMATGLKRAEWPFPVVKLFLEQSTPEAMVAAAVKPEESCEAQFYLGEWHLLRDARANAIEALRKAVESCPKGFIEYAGALAELKRLEQ